ncbi:MAG: nucleotide pyrophosphohydrolase [Candidatus Bathyarchaeota archaeon]|nr:nucleotide pyrophosphohydrolase [Candidatus Bathyarchaeota archaeon]MCZ2845334.1 nucleotide pyrophosphohydrolase [Candidatus Bathyarchaeota archaeon]
MNNKDENTTIKDLKLIVKEFVQKRNWQIFHTPRNLAESISIESAELLEIFQWFSREDCSKIKHDLARRERMREELADVLIYSLSLSNIMGIDITETIRDKLTKNENRYPISKFRGISPKDHNV